MDFYNEQSTAGKFQFSQDHGKSINDHITSYATNKYALENIKTILTKAKNINLRDPQGFTLNDEKNPIVFFDTQLGNESGENAGFDKFIKYAGDVVDYYPDIVAMDETYYEKNSIKISEAESSIIVRCGKEENAWKVYGKIKDYMDHDGTDPTGEDRGAVGGISVFSKEQIKEAAIKLTQEKPFNVLVIPSDKKTEGKTISVPTIKEIFESIEGVSVKSPRLLGGDESLGDLMTRLTATSAARNPPSKYLNLEDANEFIRKVFDEKGQLLRSTNDNLDVDIIKRVISFSNDRLSSDLASSFDNALSDLLNGATNLNPDQLTEIKVFRETSRLNAPDFESNPADLRVNAIVLDGAYAQANRERIENWQSRKPGRIVLIRKEVDLWDVLGKIPIKEPSGAFSRGYVTEEIKNAIATIIVNRELRFGVINSNGGTSPVNPETITTLLNVIDVKVIASLPGGGSTEDIIGKIHDHEGKVLKIEGKEVLLRKSKYGDSFQIDDDGLFILNKKALTENYSFDSEGKTNQFKEVYEKWVSGKLNFVREIGSSHFSWNEIVTKNRVISEGKIDKPTFTMFGEKTRWLPTSFESDIGTFVKKAGGIALSSAPRELKNLIQNRENDHVLFGAVLLFPDVRANKLKVAYLNPGEIVIDGPVNYPKFRIEALIMGDSSPDSPGFKAVDASSLGKYSDSLPKAAPYLTAEAKPSEKILIDKFIAESKEKLSDIGSRTTVFVADNNYAENNLEYLDNWQRRFSDSRFLIIAKNDDEWIFRQNGENVEFNNDELRAHFKSKIELEDKKFFFNRFADNEYFLILKDLRHYWLS